MSTKHQTPFDQMPFSERIADLIRARENKIRQYVQLVLTSEPDKYQAILSRIKDLSLRRAVERYGLLELQRGPYFEKG